MRVDPAWMSIGDLARALQRGQVSCVEIVQATLDRTKRLDKTLNTYITLLADSALAEAKIVDGEIAKGRYRGPLHGIPVAIKDHIDTAGVRTTAGAKSRITNVPTTDAAVVRRVKQAGAVIIGKANMNKFADGESGDNPDFGRIRNPWDTRYSPGGSSSGGGAQVAAGLVPLSIGSDNGGSVRIPAALCGVVGLKPTHGRISLEGIFPRLYSLDHPGPLTRSVADCAIALQILAGHDADDTTTARRPVPDFSSDLRLGVKQMAIGVDRKYATVGQSHVLSAFQAAIDVLRQLGATIVDVTIPPYAEMLAVGNTIAACEYSVAAAHLFREHPSDFDLAKPPAASGADIKAGALVPAVDYIRATQKRRLLQQEYARSTRSVAVFISPTYPLAPRPFGEYPKPYTADDAIRYTFPFDLLGLPAISVPCGFSSDGMPIGLQFVARPFDEAAVLRAAYAYEQATDWHTHHPSLAPAPSAAGGGVSASNGDSSISHSG
jgi:aspartyl-tRNA(Asn)/glutamyl-tRNA(Gln) amidotransferase subunit A